MDSNEAMLRFRPSGSETFWIRVTICIDNQQFIILAIAFRYLFDRLFIEEDDPYSGFLSFSLAFETYTFFPLLSI